MIFDKNRFRNDYDNNVRVRTHTHKSEILCEMRGEENDNQVNF